VGSSAYLGDRRRVRAHVDADDPRLESLGIFLRVERELARVAPRTRPAPPGVDRVSADAQPGDAVPRARVAYDLPIASGRGAVRVEPLVGVLDVLAAEHHVSDVDCVPRER
jgi:hypothetical protein